MKRVISPLWLIYIAKDSMLLVIITSLLFLNCTSKQKTHSIQELVTGIPSIHGNKEYLPSPFITAGDRLYMVGNQDGSFPDLGWHVAGEMGGVWDHPIKLLDGFRASLSLNNGRDSFCLNKASTFINYPVGNL